MIYSILYALIVYILIGTMVSILLINNIRRGIKAVKDITLIQEFILVLIFIMVWPYMLIKTIFRLFKK